MATPFESLVAQAVVDDLNAQQPMAPVPFVAVRKPVPTWNADAGDLQSLRCAVTALGLDSVRESREPTVLCHFDFRVVIDFQVEVNPADTFKVDDLSYLVQQVHDRYLITAPALTVAGLSPVEVMDAQRPFTYDLERLDEQGIFESYVIATVRGFRT